MWIRFQNISFLKSVLVVPNLPVKQKKDKKDHTNINVTFRYIFVTIFAAISVIYCECVCVCVCMCLCVCVALVVQHAMRMRHIVIAHAPYCHVASPALHYISPLSHKLHHFFFF